MKNRGQIARLNKIRKREMIRDVRRKNKLAPFVASTTVGLVAVGFVRADGSRADTVVLFPKEALAHAWRIFLEAAKALWQR